MRRSLRLLPLPLCIAFSLNAHAGDDMPLNWGLCPVQDVVKPFAEAQAAPEGVGIANTEQATRKPDAPRRSSFAKGARIGR